MGLLSINRGAAQVEVCLAVVYANVMSEAVENNDVLRLPSPLPPPPRPCPPSPLITPAYRLFPSASTSAIVESY